MEPVYLFLMGLLSLSVRGEGEAKTMMGELQRIAGQDHKLVQDYLKSDTFARCAIKDSGYNGPYRPGALQSVAGDNTVNFAQCIVSGMQSFTQFNVGSSVNGGTLTNTYPWYYPYYYFYNYPYDGYPNKQPNKGSNGGSVITIS